MQRPAAFASSLAEPDPTEWDTITYTYDPAGRRIKKNVVGSYIVKYVYDGDPVIAEYDDSGLLHKYIYGARVSMLMIGKSPKSFPLRYNIGSAKRRRIFNFNFDIYE